MKAACHYIKKKRGFRNLVQITTVIAAHLTNKTDRSNKKTKLLEGARVGR